MTLVAYSDSEDSGGEGSRQLRPKDESTRSAAITSEANFAVDKVHPRKIKVNLQQIEEDGASFGGRAEPAAKRGKVEGGFSGFNSMLPAPKKREVSVANGVKNTENVATRKVFSLKTGPEPGFSRESDAELKQLFSEKGGAGSTETNGASARQKGGEESNTGVSILSPLTQTARSSERRPVMFKPLSVARNTQKKTNTKKLPTQLSAPTMSPTAQSTEPATHPTAAAPVPKPNLFSIGSRDEPSIPITKAEPPGYRDSVDEDPFDSNTPPAADEQAPGLDPSQTDTQSLSSIADDLNLPPSARRQLLGRKSRHQGPSTNTDTTSELHPKIKTFDTNAEYTANNQSLLNLADQQQQQQQQHNPVRAIAPGKHSLKQLVSVASGQREALEESFAAGKRNKSEGRGKYGW